jgi:hypothetical protein
MNKLRTCVLALAAFGFVTAQGAEPFHWGVNGHAMNQAAYIDVPVATQLDLVVDLGAGWYRCDISAADFQGNTARFDELLIEAERRKLRLLPVLMPSAEFWNGQATLEQIRGTTSEFAKAIASRYRGRISHWELANELDDYALIRKGETTRGGKLWSWDGAPDGSDPDDYNQERYERAKAQLSGLYEGVKAADPKALAIVDTAGWLHYGFIERLVTEDRARTFDILAWHWYSEMGEMTNVQGQRNLIEFLKRYDCPLWLTEINRRDGSKGGKELEAADYMRNAVARLGANPGIAGVFIYELLDQPYFGDNGESNYGLVEVSRDGGGKWQVKRKKAAFAAYQDVIAATQKNKPSQ